MFDCNTNFNLYPAKIFCPGNIVCLLCLQCTAKLLFTLVANDMNQVFAMRAPKSIKEQMIIVLTGTRRVFQTDTESEFLHTG